MTKTLKEAQSYDIITGKEYGRMTAAQSKDTYAEDNAFMRKMEKLRFEDMNREELQKIYRIALKGLKMRCALDKQLSKLRVHEHEIKQRGAINHGLKYTEIYKRGRELLEQIREG